MAIDDKSKEKVAELIRSFVSTHSNESKETDYLNALKTAGTNSGEMNLPMLLLLMNQNQGAGNKGMDKIMDVIAQMKVIEMLGSMGSGNKDDYSHIATLLDSKLAALSPPKQDISIEKISSMVSDIIDKKLSSI